MRWSLFVLVAGCLSGPAHVPPEQEPAIALRAAAWPVDFERLPYPYGWATQGRLDNEAVGEPGLVILQDGSIHYLSWEALAVSRDEGVTWSLERWTVETVDAVLFSDVERQEIYKMHVMDSGACLELHASDDAGATWSYAVGCPEVPTDHPTGVAKSGRIHVIANGYPEVNYLTSDDGGLSYAFRETLTMPGTTFCDSGLVGKLAADETTMLVPKGHCRGLPLFVSDDSGTSWRVVHVGADVPGMKCRSDPDAAIDGDQWAGTWMASGGIALALSVDRGAAWQVHHVESIGTAVFPLVEFLDGQPVVAYLGTSASSDAPDTVPDDAVWHLFAGTVQDGAWESVQVTTDPVQVGPIFTYPGCGAPSDARNHADFNSIARADDALYVAFTDGCVDGCASRPAMAASRSVVPSIARIEWSASASGPGA